MQDTDLDYQEILDEIYFENKNRESEGHVASYIPELAKIDPDKYGIFLKTSDNREFEVGDSREKFSIQSISKVIALAFAMGLKGDELWERIGVEHSGNPFNSIVQVEFEEGVPRNPFINSGAIVLSDILLEELDHPKKCFLDFMRKFSGNPDLQFDEDVVRSEKEYGYRNEATANMLKALKNLKNSPEEVLDLLDQELRDVGEFLDVVEALVGGYAQHLGVPAAVVGHVEHCDRAGLNQHARQQVEILQHDQCVQRIAVFTQGVLEVAVVRGVLHGGEEDAVQAEAVRLVVDLVLDARSLGDLDGHIVLHGSLLGVLSHWRGGQGRARRRSTLNDIGLGCPARHQPERPIHKPRSVPPPGP